MEQNGRYEDDDKVCPHCGGELRWHSLEEQGALKWCESCGSNNGLKPPSVKLTFE